MKTPSLFALGALLSVSVCAFAQGPQQPFPVAPPQVVPRPAIRPSANPVPDGAPRITQNYLLTITIEDKDTEPVEMTLLLASPEFSTSFADAKQNATEFTGLVTPREDGALLLRYTLSAEIPVAGVVGGQVQVPNRYRKQATQAGVLLKPGDNLVVIKGAEQTVKLSLKLAEEKKSE